MPRMPDVTLDNRSLDGVHWNILGQVYSPKLITDDCFAWYATLPIESFIPPHVHAHQSEHIHIIDGQLDVVLDATRHNAKAGETITLPRAVPHGLFNNCGSDVRCLFWVRPRADLDHLFRRLHNMARPDLVAKTSAEYGVDFLPPQRAVDQLRGL